MHAVRFRYGGRVGHFLRAEMNASALSYPVPPRTVLLGLLGNILGLGKDEAPMVLGEARVAVGPGQSFPPRRHYHGANLRAHAKRTFQTDIDLAKIRPARPDDRLPDPTGQGAVKQVIQEWLVDPEFMVYVASDLPTAWLSDLVERLKSSRSHFTPCLGLAWMLAQVEYLEAGEAQPLSAGTHLVHTVSPRSAGELDVAEIARRGGVAVQEFRMPRTVSAERVFNHESYFLEMKGHPLPIRTRASGVAWAFGEKVVIFL